MKKILFFTLSLIASLWAAPEVGPLNDARDGQSYNTVKIGNQIWMAQNLNYTTDSSWCYKHELENCKLFGRLYSWNAAMHACPTGWHLPSNDEFEVLRNYAEGNIEVEGDVGSVLKSKYGWENNDGEAMRNLDNIGFSALPAGSHGNKFCKSDVCTYFWTSTVNQAFSDKTAFTFGLSGNDKYATKGTSSKSVGFSVRCIKDN